MLEIYTIYGGGMWKTALDAVVTLVGQNTFHTLLRIAGTFGVLAVLFTFIKQRNPMVFVQWLAIFMVITSILLVPKPEPFNPDADVIVRVRGEENTGGQEMKAAAEVRNELDGADRTSGELSRASRVIADLANSERDMLRAAENAERGRMPEREEQTLTRTIQKER